MNRLLFFFVAVFFLLQTGNAQVARHFWLNAMGYNQTLYPTSDSGYILAAVRNDLGVNEKNTITVFKLDQNYQIQDSKIIGLPNNNSGGFSKDIIFDVYDITENMTTGHYVICGSMKPLNTGGGDGSGGKCQCDGDNCNCNSSKGGCTCGGGNGASLPPSKGMVTIIDYGLNVKSIREYRDVDTFYSVYADDTYYYVCGNAYRLANNNIAVKYGIVLRDNMFTVPTNTTAYTTTQSWEYHKIKVNNNGNDIVVSGTDYNEIGYTAFDIANGNFALITNASRKFPIYSPFQPLPNSKVVVTNDPINTQNFILSSLAYNFPATVSNLITYSFGSYSVAPNMGYMIANIPYSNCSYCRVALEDVNTSPTNKIAWVVNTVLPSGCNAIYISTNTNFTLPAIRVQFTTTFSSNNTSYFSLHKVHFNQQYGDFHCGGFYAHNNGNKTTFVVAPELAVLGGGAGCGTQSSNGITKIQQQPQLTRLSMIRTDVNVTSYQWHEIKYDFCDTDCSNIPLNITTNGNCGNR